MECALSSAGDLVCEYYGRDLELEVMKKQNPVEVLATHTSVFCLLQTHSLRTPLLPSVPTDVLWHL